ncbi:MAG: response regulator [Dehalococcoidia bacterium]|nr:response regulator [Dehalococcoidia bacterium]
MDNITDAVIITDCDRRITRWNRAAEGIFGYSASETLGHEARLLHPPGEADRIWDEIRSGLETEGHWTGEVPFIRKDGSRGTCETVLVNITGPDGNPTRRLGISRDVSDRQRVHGAMIQAQKLESLGQLSGGLAHDFNNLLSAILGAVGLLRISETSLTGDDNENLDTIESAARRGADITGRLLAFARGELSRLARIDLRDVVNDALRLSRSSVPKSIDVAVDLPDEPVFAEGDAAQLQQAIINIVLNACYVMPDGGSLRLAVGSDGTTGTISIADTGPGIDAETRERLFEPFFTTKPHGLGTGLGLPSAYGIVTGHHGTIDVDSQVGEGSTFHIRIPLLDEDLVDAAPAPESVPRGGAVLVVDDDDIVRRAVRAMLVNLGFEAVEASDGQAALDLVREDPGRWSVVLLDLVMPGASGAEIFRSLSELRDDLPVVIASGYTPDRFLEDGERRRISAVLHKPFTMDRLRSTLESVGITASAPSMNGRE